MEPGACPNLTWRDGRVPVADGFDDPYFSLSDGLAETRHVFLAGNALPERFAPGFRVAELGFGTGLNLLATWRAWLAAGMTTPLSFTSFEAFPIAADDMARALAPFGELAPLTAELCAAWATGARRLELATLRLQVVVGDANATVPEWRGMADAWFLDGFSPARNPGMWSPALMAAVADHTAPGGTAATYTAAGHVRRALADAGFGVTRVPGFAHKRHMTTARMPP